MENLTKYFPKHVIFKADIMVAMLNGTIDWGLGCRLRNFLDTSEGQKRLEEVENSLANNKKGD